MNESNITKPVTDNSNSSRISPTSDGTYSCVQNLDHFAFVEVKCEVAVSTVYFFSLTKLLRPQSLELQMNIDWKLNDELRV
jgi:hypothetical protein